MYLLDLIKYRSNEYNSFFRFVLSIQTKLSCVFTSLKDIYQEGIVICDLFEISGVRIKRLLNEIKTPGTYEMEIELSDLPAGIYFYQLKTDNIKAGTRKMIVLK